MKIPPRGARCWLQKRIEALLGSTGLGNLYRIVKRSKNSSSEPCSTSSALKRFRPLFSPETKTFGWSPATQVTCRAGPFGSGPHLCAALGRAFYGVDLEVDWLEGLKPEPLLWLDYDYYDYDFLKSSRGSINFRQRSEHGQLAGCHTWCHWSISRLFYHRQL